MTQAVIGKGASMLLFALCAILLNTPVLGRQVIVRGLRHRFGYEDGDVHTRRLKKKKKMKKPDYDYSHSFDEPVVAMHVDSGDSTGDGMLVSSGDPMMMPQEYSGDPEFVPGDAPSGDSAPEEDTDSPDAPDEDTDPPDAVIPSPAPTATSEIVTVNVSLVYFLDNSTIGPLGDVAMASEVQVAKAANGGKRFRGRRGLQEEDLTPTEAEIDRLINNTFDFYAGVYQEAFDETLLSIIPTNIVTQDVSPGVFFLNYEAVLYFSSAPSAEEVATVAADIDTEEYIEFYVWPSGPYFSETESVGVLSEATDDMSTEAPTEVETEEPTAEPTETPTIATTATPTTVPTAMGTPSPTLSPTDPIVTAAPTNAPTEGLPETAAPTEGGGEVAPPTEGEEAPLTAEPTSGEAIEIETAEPTAGENPIETLDTAVPTAGEDPIETLDTDAPTAVDGDGDLIETLDTDAPTAGEPEETEAPVDGETPETAEPTDGEAPDTAEPTIVVVITEAPTEDDEDGEVDADPVPVVTAEPTRGVETVVTAAPTDGEVEEVPPETVAPSDVEETSPFPGDGETAPATPSPTTTGTQAPTACPGRSVRVTGTILLELDPDADLTEPTDDQVVEVAQHILQDFGVLLQDIYENEIRGFTATIDETNTALDGNAYPLAFDADILFSPCAPPTDEVNAVFANADYPSILENFEPTGDDNVFQHLTGEATYSGEAIIAF